MRVLGSVAAFEPAAVRLPFTTTTPKGTSVFALEVATVSLVRMMPRRTMSALSWDTANHLTVPRLDQDCQEELTSGPRTLPNGQRISGE